MIWNVLGEKLHTVAVDKLSQFTWRPRPASCLTKDKIKEVKSSMKELGEKYEANDNKLLNAKKRGVETEKSIKYENWLSWEQKFEAEDAAMAAERRKIWGIVRDSGSDLVESRERYEVLIDEVVQKL